MVEEQQQFKNLLNRIKNRTVAATNLSELIGWKKKHVRVELSDKMKPYQT